MSGKGAFRVEVSPAAAADIEAELARLRWEAGDEVAARFRDAIRACVEGLGVFPRRGKRLRIESLRRRDVRWVAVGGFPNQLVVYRRGTGVVVVVRVLHGARDLGGVLE
ncbi:MAG: type II toxin-antitoxin system RelE/ParE family toxin [Phycisphaerales bacterium]